jgi:iron complex outermembrane receptor protein
MIDSRKVVTATFLLVSTAPMADRVNAEEPAASSEVELTEVIVTARKRDEKLLDVPVPVTALSADTLETTQSVRIEDYLNLVPGAAFDTLRPGQTSISFRGINNAGSNASVVTYVDNTPFTSSTTAANGTYVTPNLDRSDIAQIEVLRGPQGTLYGANAVGGVLKYVTIKPDPNKFFGSAEITGEDVQHGGKGGAIRGAVNLPLLADTLGLRISAYTRDDPGYVSDPNLGLKNINQDHVSGGRIALQWTPTDSLTVAVSALNQVNHTSGASNVDYDPFTVRPLTGDLSQTRYLSIQPLDSRYGIFNLDVNWNSPYANIVSSTSYSTQRNNSNQDNTPLYTGLLAEAIAPGLGLDNPNDVQLDKFSQELRVSSLGQGPLEWQVGAYYTVEKSNFYQSDNAFVAATGQYLPPEAFPYSPALFFATLSEDYIEYSGFANADYHFTPQLDLGLGARYSKDTNRFGLYGGGLLVTPDEGGAPESTLTRAREHAITWSVTPRYKINETQMLYARVATGYRPGGPNALSPVAVAAGAPALFLADHLTNYEIGHKASFFDGTVTSDVSIYYIRWKDVQLPITIGGISFEGNGGRAHSQGVETAFSWRPIPHLTFSSNLSYNTNRLDSDQQSQTNPALSNAGNPLPGTPKFRGALLGDYDWQLTGTMKAFVGATFFFTTARPNIYAVGYSPTGANNQGSIPNYGVIPIYNDAGGVIGDANDSLPGYRTLDLRAGLQRSAVTLELYVKNATDARPFSEYAGFNNLGGNNLSTQWSAVVLQPRTFGVSLGYKF